MGALALIPGRATDNLLLVISLALFQSRILARHDASDRRSRDDRSFPLGGYSGARVSAPTITLALGSAATIRRPHTAYPTRSDQDYVRTARGKDSRPRA